MLTLFAVPLLALAPLGEPFTDLDYEAALAKATTDKKLLLVDFTASWCGPCKKMEKDTWENAEVRAWLGKNALALQIDVDRQKAVAQRFEIQAMPTVVAMKDGKEFDRFVGYRDAPRFLAWGNDLLAGKSTKSALEERVKTLADSGDVRARYGLAQELMRASRYDEALRHYLWVWPQSRNVPELSGVRVSFMLRDMAQLAQRHPPAKAAFAALLDEAQAKVDAAAVPAADDWRDFAALCKAFDERARIVAWYEKRRDEEGRLFAALPAESRPDRVVDAVFETLMDVGRPVDAVGLYPDASVRAATAVREFGMREAAYAGFEEETRKEAQDADRRSLRDLLAGLSGALLAVGRTDEADKVSAALLAKLDDADSRTALVRAGIELAKRPDARFIRWLDEAEAKGGKVDSLRRKLAKLDKAAAEAGGGK